MSSRLCTIHTYLRLLALISGSWYLFLRVMQCELLFFGQPDPGLFASALTFTVQSWWYFNCRSYIRCALITRFLSAQLMDNVQHLQLQFAACRCQRPISKHAGPHLIFRFIYLSTNATVCFLIFFEPLPSKTKLSRNETEPWDWVVACFAPKLALDCLDRANHFG